MKQHVFITILVSALASHFLLNSCSGDEQPITDTSTHASLNRPQPHDTSRITLIQRGPADSLYTYELAKTDHFVYGFKNRAGKVVISGRYELAANFDGSLAPVIYKGKHGFCDTSGTIIYPLEGCEFAVGNNEMSGIDYFDGFGEGLFMVVDKKGKYGYVNNRAEMVIPCQFEKAERFSNGMAIIYKDDKLGYINTKGEIVIEPTYQQAYTFSEGLAAVVINDKTGFIDQTGKLVIPAIYRQGYYFSEGLAVVTKSENYNEYFFIDQTGKTVIAGPFENAAPFVNGEAMVEKRSKCKIIDKNGTVLRSGGEQCFVGC